MFSWQEQYLTRSLRSLVRYCSCHSNIKSISSRNRVISSIYPRCVREYKVKINNNCILSTAVQGEFHTVLSLIHPLKTLHGCIPLRQMENFLKGISSHEPDLTPDPRKTSQDDDSSKSSSISSPLVRDLADSIPRGQDGIDIAEFEAACDEAFDRETTV